MLLSAITLESPRLRLRPYRLEDVPALAAYAVRPAFTRFLPLPPQTEASVRSHVEATIAGGRPDAAGNWHFVIELPGTGAIGTIRLGVKEAHRQADLGYALSDAHWHRGYASEAARRMLGFGFDRLGLERIWATADLLNTASWQVMLRAGMRREAHLRHDRLVDGQWRDTVLHARLRDDP